MALPGRGVPIERSTPLGRGLWGASVWHSFFIAPSSTRLPNEAEILRRTFLDRCRSMRAET